MLTNGDSHRGVSICEFWWTVLVYQSSQHYGQRSLLISNGLASIGWATHCQGKALAKPKEQTSVGRNSRGYLGWAIPGFLYVGIALFLVIQLLA